MSSPQFVKAYCLSLEESYEDFPFGQEWATYRHRENRKLFAAMFERLGFVWVNLKCEPLRSEFLRDVYPAVTPGDRKSVV